MKNILEAIKSNKSTLKNISVNILINIIVVTIVLIVINKNRRDSAKLIESNIQKQEEIYKEREKEKQKEINAKLSTVTEVKKQNKQIVSRIDKVEKKVDAVYAANLKKINIKYEKESKAASNTTTDSTRNILSRLLKEE